MRSAFFNSANESAAAEGWPLPDADAAEGWPEPLRGISMRRFRLWLASLPW
jgi:hypothetical protein